MNPLSTPKISYPNICDHLVRSLPLASAETIIISRAAVTQGKTTSILAAAEHYLHYTAEEPQITRKVFSVMVEALQNMTQHSDNPFSAAAAGHAQVFVLARHPQRYIIATGNLVVRLKAGSLMEKLRHINSLNANGLKKKYLDILQERHVSAKGGAGVGLLHMARKSGEKLGFNFYSLSGKYCFFWLNVSVSRKLSS